MPQKSQSNPSISSPQKMGVVTLLGRPNAGKSTLMNRILGSEISIVTSKPQTTRNKVHGIFSEDRGQILFLDTPGIHGVKKETSINSFMMKEAQTALEAPDLIWFLVDPGSKLKQEVVVLDFIEKSKAPFFLIFNKKDRYSQMPALKNEILEEIENRELKPELVLEVSSKKGKGVSGLINETFERMPEGEALYPDPDILSDRPVRFFVAEMIRKQLLLNLGDELPYSAAIKIDSYKEEPEMDRVEATIFMERESQKGMVIGKKASKIKEIGIKTRQEMETFLGKKAFLGLKVQVLKGWSSNPKALKKLGYFLPDEPSGKM